MDSKGEARDDMMLLGLSEPLALLVARRFTAAKNAGSLVFSQTEVTSLQSSTVPVSYIVKAPRRSCSLYIVSVC